MVILNAMKPDSRGFITVAFLIIGVMKGPSNELASAVTGVPLSFTAAKAGLSQSSDFYFLTCSWELVQLRFHVFTTQYFLLN